MCKKYYILNPSTCTCENGEYLENVIDDSVVRCDEIIDAVQSETINFNKGKATCKMDNFSFLLAFVLTIILLLITVGIYYYYYHIKHRAKQKQILPYYYSNNELKEINITHIM